MTIKRRIRQRGVNAALIAFVYLMTGIFSIAQAQSFASNEKDKVMQISNANKSIHHVPNANLGAKAVKLNLAINSAYEELKPALAPSGTMLFFSWIFRLM